MSWCIKILGKRVVMTLEEGCNMTSIFAFGFRFCFAGIQPQYPYHLKWFCLTVSGKIWANMNEKSRNFHMYKSQKKINNSQVFPILLWGLSGFHWVFKNLNFTQSLFTFISILHESHMYYLCLEIVTTVNKKSISQTSAQNFGYLFVWHSSWKAGVCVCMCVCVCLMVNFCLYFPKQN